MEKIKPVTKEQISDLVERCAIWGAFKIGKPHKYGYTEKPENCSSICIGRYGHDYVNVTFNFSPSNGVDDNDYITNKKDISLEELYKFDTIEEMRDYCKKEQDAENKKIQDKIDKERKKDKERMEKEELELFERLKKKFNK